MNRPAPDPALVALARHVEQLRREVNQHRADIDRAQETGDSAHRFLADLVDRVVVVADTRATAGSHADDDGHRVGVESWLAAPRPAALHELVEWMDQVLVHYPGAADALGQCWSWHPWVIEELLALKAAWVEAYQSDLASGAKAMDWHERHRPGVMVRIGQGIGGCSIEAHQKGHPAPITSLLFRRADEFPSPPIGRLLAAAALARRRPRPARISMREQRKALGAAEKREEPSAHDLCGSAAGRASS